MKSLRNQNGFSVIEISLVVLVAAIMVFAGYTIYSRQQDKKDMTPSTTQQKTEEQPRAASDVTSPPEIKSTADLDNAEDTLDQTDPGGSNNADGAQLDNEVSSF